MGDATTQERTFSEQEMTAIIADRLKAETASLTAETDQLKAQVTDLGTKLDVETSAREAAEQRATTTEEAFTAYKAEVEGREAASKRKDERVAAVREAAKHLPEKFFEDEARVERISAMDDDSFSAYLADMAAAAPVPAGDGTPPRETAIKGDPITAPEGETASAARGFLMRGLPTKEG